MFSSYIIKRRLTSSIMRSRIRIQSTMPPEGLHLKSWPHHCNVLLQNRNTNIKTKTTRNLWNLGEVGCRLGRPAKYPWFSVLRGAVPCKRDYQDTKVTVYVHLWERCQETPLNSILTRQSKSKSTSLAFLWSKSINIYCIIIISTYIQVLNMSV